jgi:hypothetical protein
MSTFTQRTGHGLNGENRHRVWRDFRSRPASTRSTAPPGAQAPAARSPVGQIRAFTPGLAAPYPVYRHADRPGGDARPAAAHPFRLAFLSLHPADHQRHADLGRRRPQRRLRATPRHRQPEPQRTRRQKRLPRPSHIDSDVRQGNFRGSKTSRRGNHPRAPHLVQPQ